MTAMRDIFIAAAKIKKSSAYKFTRLDEPNNYAAGRGQYLRHLMAKPAFIPLGGNIPLKPPLIDRHLAINVKSFRAFRAFTKLTKDFYMKFIRTLLVISIFSATQLTTAQAKKPDAFVQQILEQYYPANEKARKAYNESREKVDTIKKCYFSEDKETAGNEEGFIYGACMYFVSEKTVDTPQGKLRYILFSGNSIATGHSESGLDSLFIFSAEGDGKNWKLLSRKETNAANSWGAGTTEAKWMEFGPGLWGIVSEGGFSTMGIEQSIHHILLYDGKEIHKSVIPVAFANGAAGGCGDGDVSAKNADKEKLPDCAELEAKIKIRHDLPATSGIYSLQVSVNGYDGLKLIKAKGKKSVLKPIKEYKNKKFLFPYNPDKHEYVMPADYPKSLRFLDDGENTDNQ